MQSSEIEHPSLKYMLKLLGSVSFRRLVCRGLGTGEVIYALTNYDLNSLETLFTLVTRKQSDLPACHLLLYSVQKIGGGLPAKQESPTLQVADLETLAVQHNNPAKSHICSSNSSKDHALQKIPVPAYLVWNRIKTFLLSMTV